MIIVNVSFLKFPKLKLLRNTQLISLSLTPPRKYKAGFWFCIKKQIKLINKETGEKYSLLKTKGIKKCPRRNSASAGRTLNFKLYFKRIADTSVKHSLIEDENDTSVNPFNIYNIQIK